jgi:hypothetical protein
MTRRARVLLAVLAGCVCLIAATVAWATVSYSIQVYFSPNKLGAPANISVKTKFAYTGSVPTPLNRVVAYGPAGLGVNVQGIGTCDKAKLEAEGPSGCPADSSLGFGGGVGLVELAKEVIKDPFTLNFFLAPRENGHLAFLIYVNASSPVSLQLVLVAKEVYGPKPYGWGVTVEIPPIPTLPGASYASAENVYFTFGGQHFAYYKKIGGKRKLIHVKGVIVPRTCPRGGFPFEAMLSFEDGTTSAEKYASPCPRK